MPQLTSALILYSGAIGAGTLAGWAWWRFRAAAAYVPVREHREEMKALRQRYRRRLRALRDALLQKKISEAEARSRLRAAEGQQLDHHQLLTDRQAEVGRLQAQLAEQAAALDELTAERDAAAERSAGLTEELDRVRKRLAAHEHEQGLLRIERDELVAQTQRLRTLAPPEPEAALTAAETQRNGSGASRVELAERNARIHELECQLRESEGRASELESSLNTWKYRIAPLALHMQMQRDKARRGRARPPAADDAAPADDFGRIEGISPALVRKLAAEGVTRFAQLADMSPAELANLAMRVGEAATRPQRDRWAEQARDLCV